MTTRTMRRDPAMLGTSNHERNAGDRYWTEPWVTRALLRDLGAGDARLRHLPGRCVVWEPAAGRGDMVRVLLEAGYGVLASDVDTSEWREEGRCSRHDFLNSRVRYRVTDKSPVRWIVTNPPYRHAVEFIRAALSCDDALLVAMLLRSDFKSGSTRVPLFTDPGFPLAREVVLTNRPRWDDWDAGLPPRHHPRHNYSWLVWRRGHVGPPTVGWQGRGP